MECDGSRARDTFVIVEKIMTLVSASPAAYSNGEQADGEPIAGRSVDAKLAKTGLEPCGAVDGEDDDKTPEPAQRGLGSSSPSQPFVAHYPSGDQPLAQLDAFAVDRVQQTTNDNTKARSAVSLVADFAWNERTWLSPSSQWKCWIEFCTDSDLVALLVTDDHFLAFVCWLSLERSKPHGRKVSYKSLAQYFAAVS